MHQCMPAKTPRTPPSTPHAWDDLRVFLAVVRAGSFTEAARRLGVEQSTVSRRVAALERNLAAHLFDRTPRGLRNTPLAEQPRSRAEQVAAAVLAVDDDARGSERAVAGHVRLALTEGLSLTVVVPMLLPELRRAYPELVVDLLCDYASADLLQREADIAIRFYRPTRGDLVATRVARLPTAVLGQRDYVRSRGRRRTPDHFDWVGFHMPGFRAPEEQWHQQHVGVAPVIRSNSYVSQVAAVRAGLGLALLTRSLCRVHPELREIELGLPEGPVLELWLVTHRAIRDLPRVAAVFDHLETGLRALDGI